MLGTMLGGAQRGMGAPPQLISATTEWRCYTWETVFIFVPLTADGDFLKMRAMLDAFAARHGKFSMVTWIKPGARPPSAETRANINKHMKELEGNMQCTLALIEGTGFFASTFISIGSLMMNLRKGGHPRGLVQDRRAAADWLVKNGNLPSTSTMDAVLAAIEAAHADITAARAGAPS